MPDHDRRSELRGLVFRRDGEGLVASLQEQWPDDALQLVGDGLVAAVAAGSAHARTLAHRCSIELQERGWTGDQELAAALEAALSGASLALLPLPVDLEELAMVLEGDPVNGGGRIDLTTGEVWPEAALEYAEYSGDLDGEEEDEARWLSVQNQGSHQGYRDMELFIAGMEDDRLAERLERAIAGSRAFRRFKDVLGDSPDALERWYGFSDERQRGRVRAWLADEGYTPIAPQGDAP